MPQEIILGKIDFVKGHYETTFPTHIKHARFVDHFLFGAGL